MGRVSEQQDRMDINWVQVCASALAAVSSAVLLSTVGVAGTIIGAAVGSVIATVGAAVYSYSLRISRERVAAAQAAAVARMSRVRTGTHTRTVDLEDKPEDEGRAPWREALARLPWKWIAILSGAVFVIAMIVILGFELITGQAVSDATGGTGGAGHRTSLGFGTATKHSSTPSPSPSPSSGSSSSAPTAPTSAATRATPPGAPPGGPASDTPSSGPTAGTSSAPTSSAPTTSAPSSAASSPTG